MKVQRDEKNILFPLTRSPNEAEIILIKKVDFEYKIEEQMPDPVQFKKIEKVQDLLKEFLTDEEIKLIPHSFDIIGHILVIDLSINLSPFSVSFLFPTSHFTLLTSHF